MQTDDTTPRYPTVRVNLLRAHGSPTLYRYKYLGCRCNLCLAANAEASRRYYKMHREEAAKRKHRWSATHREEIAEKRHRWYVAHRDEVAEKKRRYRAAHLGASAKCQHRWYVAHRDEVAKYQRRWSAAHPTERAANNRNYKARKRSAPGTHTGADVRAQYARQKGRCFWGRKRNPDCAVSLKAGYHVDHVTPLVKRGSNGTENLVLSCSSCNLRKGMDHPMDWAGVML